MKLKKKRSKVFNIILIVAGVALLGLIIGLIIHFIPDKQEEHDPYEIKNIQLSAYPSKSIYYVGEEFDPTGCRIQVLTYDYDLSYFVDYTKLTFSGFDSSEVNDSLPITVSYRGFTTSFNVKIIEPPSDTPTLSSYEVCDLKTEYRMNEWNEYGINVVGGTLKFIYSDGSVKENIYIQTIWCSGIVKVDEPCQIEITITYDDDGRLYQIPVTITITE